MPVSPEIAVDTKKERVDERFQKQILLLQALEQDGRMPARKVIASNLDRKQGTPFAIMEVLGGDQLGFVTKEEDVEIWGEKHAQECIRNLGVLNQIDTDSLPPELQEALEREGASSSDYGRLRKDIESTLGKKVKALDSPEGGEEFFHEVLNRRFGIENFKERVVQILDHWEELMKSQDGTRNALFHGDLGGDNLYIHDDDSVEFIDWEFAGMCKNPAISAIIDFGNLRARTWNNKEFREAMDAALTESYTNRGEGELGRAIVSLGILRSHMGLAGFFENYDLGEQRKEREIRRREATEGDLKKVWEVAGLEL